MSAERKDARFIMFEQQLLLVMQEYDDKHFLCSNMHGTSILVDKARSFPCFTHIRIL